MLWLCLVGWERHGSWLYIVRCLLTLGAVCAHLLKCTQRKVPWLGRSTLLRCWYWRICSYWAYTLHKLLIPLSCASDGIRYWCPRCVQCHSWLAPYRRCSPDSVPVACQPLLAGYESVTLCISCASSGPRSCTLKPLTFSSLCSQCKSWADSN